MTFDEVLDQVRELLRQQGRLTYGAMKRRFGLDEAYLEDIKGELIEAEQVAKDEDGKVLVWIGTSSAPSSEFKVSSAIQSSTPNPQSLAERRQLTVMFCDLVGSTTLSQQLDPEEYHQVVSRYQETCTAVIRRYAGHIAQHLGDGLLVYFGYPTAHEDDAQQAVRTGLEIIEALQIQVPALVHDRADEILPVPPLSKEGTHMPPLRKGAARSAGGFSQAKEREKLQVRIGIHTGLVVIGEVGSSEKREILALGETPNIAARVQGVAAPDTVVMSGVTQRLVHGLFEYQDLGPQTLKGISTPLSLYRVIGESAAHSRFDVSMQKGLTPLVGREEELGVLRQRWDQAKAGRLEEGLALLTEAVAIVNKMGERYHEAELYRLKGELLLQQANQKAKGKNQKEKNGN
jgi:class 3 adenylate cyclase